MNNIVRIIRSTSSHSFATTTLPRHTFCIMRSRQPISTQQHNFTTTTPMKAHVPDDGAARYDSLSGKLDGRLLKALDVLGYQHMTPVQQRILTELPDWRNDCLVQAKTGTGKTIAFLLPALHSMLQNRGSAPPGQVSILIITPTRELAQQIAKECDQLTSQLEKPLECHIAVGGTARASTLKKFMNGSPSILVATPGRLGDYLSEDAIAHKLANIKTLILDEADTMLDAGFLAAIKAILQRIPDKRTAKWQGMCFSATLPPKVKEVVSVVLNPGYNSISTINPNETPTHERVPQYHIVNPGIADTFTVLTSLLQYEAKSSSKIIVFGVTANLVALYSKLFSQDLIKLPVFEIHSRLSQSARTKVTAQFKEANSGVMFASDVVGRGMDFPNVDLVVQVGLPANAEQYVHRVGRTARAGNDGRAIILLTEAESFFIKRNGQLPIKPHTHAQEILDAVPSIKERVERAMHSVDETVKQRAYVSFIGFFAGSGQLKPMRMDKAGLVQLANEMAVKGMLCPEPPAMDKMIVGKMGLKGVPGITFASRSQDSDNSRPRQRPRTDAGGINGGDHTQERPSKRGGHTQQRSSKRGASH